MEITYVRLISGVLFVVCILISYFQKKEKEEIKKSRTGIYVFLGMVILTSLSFVLDRTMFDLIVYYSTYIAFLATIIWFAILMNRQIKNV